MSPQGEKSNERVEHAENEVRRSTEQLEEAMDQLKGRVEDGSRTVREIRDRANELVETIKDARGTLRELVSEAVQEGEAYVSKQRQAVEGYLAESGKAFQSRLREGVRESLSEARSGGAGLIHDTERALDSFFGNVRRSSEQLLSVTEDRRSRALLLVFVTGAALGLMFAQRGKKGTAGGGGTISPLTSTSKPSGAPGAA